MVKESEEYYYPGGEFLDSKWKTVQEFIFKLSKGEYDLQLPENLGQDYIDAVLLALKLMGENLSEKEDLYFSLGALDSMDKGLIELNENYEILKVNRKALTFFNSKNLEGTLLFNYPDFKRIKEKLLFKYSDTEIKRTIDTTINGFNCRIELINFQNSLQITRKGFLLKIWAI
jgi:hypothetical protein